MLYTSGSTGQPKGLVHSTGGYMTQAAVTHHAIFDYQPGDVYACVADVGWITGHTCACTCCVCVCVCVCCVCVLCVVRVLMFVRACVMWLASLMSLVSIVVTSQTLCMDRWQTGQRRCCLRAFQPTLTAEDTGRYTSPLVLVCVRACVCVYLQGDSGKHTQRACDCVFVLVCADGRAVWHQPALPRPNSD